MIKVTLDEFFNRKYSVKYHVYDRSSVNSEEVEHLLSLANDNDATADTTATAATDSVDVEFVDLDELNLDALEEDLPF